MSSSAVDYRVVSPIIDLLSHADDLSPVDIASSSSPDRLEAAVDLQRLQPTYQGYTPLNRPGRYRLHFILVRKRLHLRKFALVVSWTST